MKKRALWAIWPILILGAILWSVNWRLDHPPLSKTDLKFRAAVAGADELHVYFPRYVDDKSEIGRWRGREVRQWIEEIHLTDQDIGPTQSRPVFLMRFLKKGRTLGTFALEEDDGDFFYSSDSLSFNRGCALSRRSPLRLGQTFDALARQSSVRFRP